MRVLFSSSHYAETTGRVKAGAFLPAYNRDQERHETSVFDADDLDEAGKRMLEDWTWDQRKGRATLKGRAEVVVAVLRLAELQFLRNDEPIDRHGLILGWPEPGGGQDQAEVVAQTRLKATIVADESTLHLR